MAMIETLLTQHIDLWTSAIKRKSSTGRGSSKKIELYGIKKLRELILELAVRGLLAPQDPNDKPASELLKKIAAEKAKLVKEGKIKKGKPLPPITAEEKVFELPNGWEWSKLGTLMEMFNGRAFSQTEWSTEGLPIIRIQNLNDKNAPFNFFNGEISENNFVEPGTFLISWSGTPGTSFGAFIWNGAPGALNQHINKCIIFGDEINREYLRLAVNSCMDHLIENAQGGVGLKHVTKGTLNNCVFAIPPLPEQHRIVAKVDELMALCDQLEQETENSLSAHQTLVETLLNALTTSSLQTGGRGSAWLRIADHFDTLFTTEQSIDTLKQAILQLAVLGILEEFPADSCHGVLKNFLAFGPKNGFSPRESTQETVAKVLKLGATSYGSLDMSQVKSFEGEIPANSHLWLKAGDILIQRGNSHIFVGCNVHIDYDMDNVIYPDLMMKLRAVDTVYYRYLSLWLSALPSRQHMWNGMTGTSGTMPKISKSVVESIPFTAPPLHVQHRIVAKVDKLMALCDRLKARLSDAQTTQLHLADAMTELALAR